MAEFVQTKLESMIPELEAMAKIELFTLDEIRRITKRRKEFEYKLQRGAKYKEDLLNYIRYEWDLLVVIKNKSLTNKTYAPKRNSVAHSVSYHIQKLFTDALTRFSADIKIWLSYIDFCTQLKLYPLVSQTLEKMLSLHQDKPQLFVTAAQTEFTVLNSMDRARKFLLNGIRLHKESELLYRESFNMELNYAKNLREEYSTKEDEIPDGDPVLKGGLAELIYESSLMNVRSIELASDLFLIAKRFPFAKSLATRIFNDISEEFKEKERRWDIVARYALENPSSQRTPKQAVEDCIKVYEEAVQSLNTYDMWAFYIDAVLEINEDKTYLNNFKTNCLMKAFLDAHCAEKLKEEYYLKWVSTLNGENDEEKRKEVLRCATECFPASVKIWEQYLKVLSLKSATSDSKHWNTMMKKFEEGIAVLKKHRVCPLPLWKLIINFAQLTDPTKVENLMLRGVREGGEVSVAIKTMYLEWVVLSRSLKASRKVYSELSDLPPFSLQLHKKMIEFENHSVATDVSKIRECYTKMTDQFGKDDPDVWIDFIKFEQVQGDPTRIPRIYDFAKMKLKQPFTETFIARYSLHMINAESVSDDEEEERPQKIQKLQTAPENVSEKKTKS